MALTHLLDAWRSRWNRQQDSVPSVDYKLTRRGPLGWRLAQAMGRLPAPFSALMWMLGLIVLLPLPAVEFTIWGQLSFLTFMALLVLPLRPYFGSVPTGVLLGLALLLSIRYLWWRASSTFVWSAAPILTLSMLLWVAEFVLLGAFALRTVLAAWPLIHVAQPLSTGRRHWPSIEVVVVGHELADDVAGRMIQALTQIDWPLSRLQLHFLDTTMRPVVRDQARHLGVNYRVLEDLQQLSQREFARRLMGIGVGELLIVIDSEGDVPVQLAQSVGPWFARDPQLGLLFTPRSRLGSELSAHQVARLAQAQDIAPLAAIRRTVLAQAHAAPDADAFAESLPATVRSQGFAAACIAPVAHAHAHNPGPDQWFWIAHGATRSALALRDVCGAVLGRLQSLETFALYLFLGWPLFALFTSVNPVRANAWYWLANAVPVVVAWYFVSARTRSARRFSLAQELRHVFLAAYLALALIPTTLRTVAQRVWLGWRGTSTSANDAPHYDRTEWLGHVLWGAVNALILGVALHRMAFQLGKPSTFDLLFCVWAAYNLLGVWIWWAIQRDQAAYAVHRQGQMRKSAMLRLTNGRTLACHTSNFPERELQLQLPSAVSLQAGDSVSITVFHGDHEYVVQGEVTEASSESLSAWVKNGSMSLYRSLAAAALLPGAGFPRWLPGPDVARAIPRILMRLFARLFNALLFIPRVLTRPLRSPLSNPTGKRPT